CSPTPSWPSPPSAGTTPHPMAWPRLPAMRSSTRSPHRSRARPTTRPTGSAGRGGDAEAKPGPAVAATGGRRPSCC
ncbi:MAG: hypothetical protein AVDCRST_MAG02-1096, partial [uncultured Rubrobacteraceae bacterium]